MPWLAHTLERLLKRLREDRFPHALLLGAERGTGKRAFADELASLLVCDSADLNSGKACGKCKQCELVAGGSHPDIRHYQPENSRMIKIDQIRALGAFAVNSPQVSRRKIAIIDRADQLNINSANALLKTLEEPSYDVVLVLLQENGRPVLPTIRSRCQCISIARPSEDEAREWLSIQIARTNPENTPSPEQQKNALSIAGDAPLLALEYLTGDFMKHRAEAFEAFRLFMKGQISTGDAAKPFKSLGLDASLLLFEGWAGDLARMNAGGSARDSDAADMLSFLARHNPAWRAHELIDLIRESRSAGVYNVNPELEAGRILLAWQKLMPLKRRAVNT